MNAPTVDRESSGRRVIFGVRPVEELVRANPRSVSVIYVAEGKRSPEAETALAAAKDRGIAVEIRPRALIADLAGGTSHQGIVAVVGAFAYASVETILEHAKTRNEQPLVVLLDGISDPQNLGAVVRSAEVLGAHGVIMADRNSAPVAGGAVKASAGATERVLIARVESLLKTIDKLREAGVMVWAAAGGTGEPPAKLDLTTPVALVIGSEGRGLREAVARRCDGIIAIPMKGAIASLNASAAAAILLYEALRQRSA
ncbi:MAG: 23S rRNA (guanosine(2251)-2'-O)-methyltransferase RlmB [Deltaproteobacteria bacterium]|nr:23S rRNA (guanosine(2251)-2'-O)-methyltransferase RlmB [Deltaproteobacteria bacterium]